MPHRAHLFSLRLAHAFREACIDQPYNSRRFLRDLMAGVTVGIIAIPLAMALAIASGVAPQYGLYTAFIAGFIIALTGGSRFSVSGPTAAFVVILYPIAQTYGLGGLLLATLMSGVLLVIMALMRLGRFIEYIPESVTLGFTSGIAVVIATLQVNDFFGLSVESMPEHYWDKLAVLAQSFPALDSMSALVALVTLAIMLIWPRLRTPVPPHLPAVIVGSLIAIWLNANGASVDTIGSRFSYLLPGGGTGAGIPPFLPEFAWPWQQADASGNALGLSWSMVRELLPAAFAIAMLGAIESLLCAVVLDGMTGKRHSANSELMGQGLGNIIVPFFGGITATAAIARSAANYRAGAESPVAAMIHAMVVLLALVSLAGILAYLPMPAMAALLIMVAWNMSEAPKAVRLLKTAPRSDVWVFLTCFSLTVALDMVIAITTGVLLAAVLFMREMAEMTKVTDITTGKRVSDENLPAGWRVFKINGPLFFAAADRIFGELAELSRNVEGIILYMDGVTVLDAGGLSALNKLIATCQKDGTRIVIADLQSQPQRALARSGLGPVEGVLQFAPTLREALALPLSSMAKQAPTLTGAQR
ncbi:C4-dicarboxylic acid transporter DauA [Marinobacter sp. DY40_1A1]|uniref:C4-dicarboxylic acid transporter DauA n=1 Tax=Marinobacter sp. DY40_1A1 TaxID=2583229 RepID=UPI001904764A|nr:C4-dicarboxylic acid transporter DauA [Marinobacter sp. DY40_1A1]MBK1886292.1 C4-dicarboxylic acid transporter DauA [Marinobacter sp. DY40_1A1]